MCRLLPLTNTLCIGHTLASTKDEKEKARQNAAARPDKDALKLKRQEEVEAFPFLFFE